MKKPSLKELNLYFVKAKCHIKGLTQTQFWPGEYFIAGNEAEAELKAMKYICESWWDESDINTIVFTTDEIRKSIFY